MAYPPVSPVAWWKFDDGSGTSAVDSSSNSLTGTLTNFTGSPWIAGRFDGGLTFDGSNDHVIVGNVSQLDFTGSGAFSISAWVNTASTANQLVLSKANSTNTLGWVFGLVQDGGNHLQIYLELEGSLGVLVSKSTGIISPPTGWSHIVMTYDGSGNTSGVKFYIDGVLTGTTSLVNLFGGTTANSSAAVIGSYNETGTSLPFAGTSDEIMVFNSVLSQGSVDILFAGPPVVTNHGLFAFPP